MFILAGEENETLTLTMAVTVCCGPPETLARIFLSCKIVAEGLLMQRNWRIPKNQQKFRKTVTFESQTLISLSQIGVVKYDQHEYKII